MLGRTLKFTWLKWCSKVLISNTKNNILTFKTSSSNLKSSTSQLSLETNLNSMIWTLTLQNKLMLFKITQVLETLWMSKKLIMQRLKLSSSNNSCSLKWMTSTATSKKVWTSFKRRWPTLNKRCLPPKRIWTPFRLNKLKSLRTLFPTRL